MRIDRLQQAFNVRLKWTHFPLHPETPSEGKALSELFAGRDIDLDAMYERMKDLMDAEGLEYGQRTHTYNSRLAQELAIWADDFPEADALHAAMYRAYFVEGINIGDIDELVAIAARVGLDAAAAREVLENRSVRDQVDDDWQRSRQLGVTGVPTFVAGGYGVVGAQPYETLEQLLEHVGAERRSAAGEG